MSNIGIFSANLISKPIEMPFCCATFLIKDFILGDMIWSNMGFLSSLQDFLSFLGIRWKLACNCQCKCLKGFQNSCYLWKCNWLSGVYRGGQRNDLFLNLSHFTEVTLRSLIIVDRIGRFFLFYIIQFSNFSHGSNTLLPLISNQVLLLSLQFKVNPGKGI